MFHCIIIHTCEFLWFWVGTEVDTGRWLLRILPLCPTSPIDGFWWVTVQFLFPLFPCIFEFPIVSSDFLVILLGCIRDTFSTGEFAGLFLGLLIFVLKTLLFSTVPLSVVNPWMFLWLEKFAGVFGVRHTAQFDLLLLLSKVHALHAQSSVGFWLLDTLLVDVTQPSKLFFVGSFLQQKNTHTNDNSTIYYEWKDKMWLKHSLNMLNTIIWILCHLNSMSFKRPAFIFFSGKLKKSSRVILPP